MPIHRRKFVAGKVQSMNSLPQFKPGPAKTEVKRRDPRAPNNIDVTKRARTASLPPEPRADKRPSVSTWHGATLIDEFAWLKAANWQEVMRDPAKLDPAIRAYLEAENAYAEHALADSAALQATLFAEMKGRIRQDDATVPRQDGPFGYYVRYRDGGQHPAFCREPRAGGPAQVMVDGDALAAGKAYFQFGATTHSPDHRFLAWSADEAGAEFFTVRVRDLASGRDLADVVPDAVGPVVWTADAAAFYYIRLDRNHRPSRVFRHRLGTPAEEDALVYAETDPRFFVAVSRLQSGRFANISISDHETSESRLVDLTVADAVPVLVAAREAGVQYHVEHHPALSGEPVLVIRANADGAEDFKIVVTPLATPGRAHWRDVVAHRPGV